MSTIPSPYYGGGQVKTPVDSLKVSGAPSSADVQHNLCTLACDPSTGTIYGLAKKVGGVATWATLGGGATVFPSTPYVVGPSGQAGYQTVQSAIFAASAAGGGLVYIQPGTYTENLLISNNVSLQGASQYTTTIVGTHVPPDGSGTLVIDSLTLQSATHVLSSSFAGTATILFQHCNFTITNGYACNLANWTGSIVFDLCGEVGSTSSGILNNATTAPLAIYNSSIGAGTGQTLTTSGSAVVIDESSILCPMTMSGSGTLSVIAGSVFTRTLTTAGSITTSITGGQFNTGATASISHGSSGTITLNNVTINSSNNPAIAGAGAGAVIIGEVVWLDNAIIAAALTITTGTELSASSYTTSDATNWATWIANGITAGGTGANVNLNLAGQGTGVVSTGALTTVGTASINASGAGVTTIGTGGTGAVNIGNATGNTAVTGSLSATTLLTSGTNFVTWTSNTLTAGGPLSDQDINLAGKGTGGVIVTVGNLSISQAGKGLRVEGGAVTDTIGSGTLASGTETISNTNISSTDRIFLSRIASNGSTTLGELTYTINAGVSFTVNSRIIGTPGSVETGDTSTYTYLIVRQL